MKLYFSIIARLQARSHGIKSSHSAIKIISRIFVLLKTKESISNVVINNSLSAPKGLLLKFSIFFLDTQSLFDNHPGTGSITKISIGCVLPGAITDFLCNFQTFFIMLNVFVTVTQGAVALLRFP
mgnify:CR=1 FL=1